MFMLSIVNVCGTLPTFLIVNVIFCPADPSSVEGENEKFAWSMSNVLLPVTSATSADDDEELVDVDVEVVVDVEPPLAELDDELELLQPVATNRLAASAATVTRFLLRMCPPWVRGF